MKMSETLDSVSVQPDCSRAMRIENLDTCITNYEIKFNQAIQYYNKRVNNLKEDFYRYQKFVSDDNK